MYDNAILLAAELTNKHRHNITYDDQGAFLDVSLKINRLSKYEHIATPKTSKYPKNTPICIYRSD